MDPKSFNCPYCEKVKDAELEYLRRHCSRGHKVKAEDLYLKLFLNGERPDCACGCGETITQFWGVHRGYSDFIRGHQARVKNNWGHNRKAQEKSQETRRQMHERGEIKIWNKGMTKEDDPRIEAYGEKCSDTLKNDPDHQKQRSEHMKKQWQEGSIVHQRGSDHSQWKGGVSSLQQLCRANLFRAWSRPIMVRDKFTCQHCGAQGKLNVHHYGEKFAPILQKAMQHFGHTDARELTFEQKDALSEWVVRYHADNSVLGVTLCEDCHVNQHAMEEELRRSQQAEEEGEREWMGPYGL